MGVINCVVIVFRFDYLDSLQTETRLTMRRVFKGFVQPTEYSPHTNKNLEFSVVKERLKYNKLQAVCQWQKRGSNPESFHL